MKKKKVGRKKPRPSASHLRQSKTEGFLESIRGRNAMVEYFTRLKILNPAAARLSELNEPRREGGFVRLAHAREEFTAPVLTKGKAVTSREREKKKGTTPRRRRSGV